jgi:hypothetical protein
MSDVAVVRPRAQGHAVIQHASITIAALELMYRIRKDQFKLGKIRADGKDDAYDIDRLNRMI